MIRKTIEFQGVEAQGMDMFTTGISHMTHLVLHQLFLEILIYHTELRLMVSTRYIVQQKTNFTRFISSVT